VRAKRLERRRVVPIRTPAAASVACGDAHRRVRAERKRSIPIATTTERGPPSAISATTERGPPSGSLALHTGPAGTRTVASVPSANGRSHSRPRRSVALHPLLTPHCSIARPGAMVPVCGYRRRADSASQNATRNARPRHTANTAARPRHHTAHQPHGGQRVIPRPGSATWRPRVGAAVPTWTWSDCEKRNDQAQQRRG
jgi:hypothetical protein